MWILWDVYHGYHGIYCQTCWGIGGFLAKRVSLLKHALAEGHLFFYNLLVVIKSIGIYFCRVKKLYNAPTHPDAFSKWHFSISGSLTASWNFIE